MDCPPNIGWAGIRVSCTLFKALRQRWTMNRNCWFCSQIQRSRSSRAVSFGFEHFTSFVWSFVAKDGGWEMQLVFLEIMEWWCFQNNPCSAILHVWSILWVAALTCISKFYCRRNLITEVESRQNLFKFSYTKIQGIRIRVMWLWIRIIWIVNNHR